ALGIVHRDLKPANVWLTSDGVAKLGDFGVALSAGRTRLSAPGSVVGTVDYMAPEQALGDQGSARSDLYSLGAMLYAMVAGRPPFVGGDAVSVASQHVSQQPEPPSLHEPSIPRALDALILRLLAKAPDDRPSTASAVVEQLARIRSTLANSTARPANAGAPTIDWPRPPARDRAAGRPAALRPRTLVLVGGLMAVLVAVALERRGGSG